MWGCQCYSGLFASLVPIHPGVRTGSPVLAPSAVKQEEDLEDDEKRVPFLGRSNSLHPERTDTVREMPKRARHKSFRHRGVPQQAFRQGRDLNNNLWMLMMPPATNERVFGLQLNRRLGKRIPWGGNPPQISITPGCE